MSHPPRCSKGVPNFSCPIRQKDVVFFEGRQRENRPLPPYLSLIITLMSGSTNFLKTSASSGFPTTLP